MGNKNTYPKKFIISSRQHPIKPDLILKTINTHQSSKVIICKVQTEFKDWIEIKPFGCFESKKNNEKLFDAEWSPNGESVLVHGSIYTYIFAYEDNHLEKKKSLKIAGNDIHERYKLILLDDYQVLTAFYAAIKIFDMSKVNIIYNYNEKF
jgi:hypothetical protein